MGMLITHHEGYWPEDEEATAAAEAERLAAEAAEADRIEAERVAAQEAEAVRLENEGDSPEE